KEREISRADRWKSLVFSLLSLCWLAGGVWSQSQAEVGLPADRVDELTADWSADRKLYPDIEQQRWEFSEPHPLVVTCLRVDPQTPA
ncbi:MAG: hypothetical protein ACK6CE_01540, partial [Planctomycetota bacterium]